MTDELPARLIEARDEGRLIPFVGAGVSMAVCRPDGSGAFPSWVELLEAAADKLEREKRKQAALVRAYLDQDEPNTLDAARHAQAGLNALWASFLGELLGVSRREVDEGTLEFARAVWGLGSRLVITTNYDKVLRWACPESDDLRRWILSVPEGQVAELQGRLREPTVWHLHGSVDDTSQIILSPDGYAKLYPSDERAGKTVHEVALETLRQLMMSHTLLFVGLEDPYLRRQLGWVETTFAGCGGPHYVVGLEAQLAKLHLNTGDLDLQPICVKDSADIPRLLRELGPKGEVDPEQPPSSTVVVSIPKAIVEPKAGPRPSPNLEPEDVLAGRYELIDKGGDGGFATVWRARDREREIEVAVKVLHTQWCDKQGRLDRFRRGAQAMQRLEHRGIVEILEPPKVDGHHHFFVMPWQEGKDLRAAVQAGRVERDAALEAVADALEGLAYAHEMGLVHRDVKPANILLDADNRGSIADFDLVQGMESKQGTRTSAGMGTVAYAAPELFDDAANADARADLYGAAMCVLFALTGGDPPWLVSLLKPKWLDEELKCGWRLREALRGALATEKGARRGSCEGLAAAVRHELAGVIEVVSGPSIEVQGVELVLIPGGTFMMGTAAEDPEGLDSERPRHEVELASFYLAKTPVTNRQYERYLAANPTVAKPRYWGDRRYNQPQQPVIGVSWRDAQAYCEWAGLLLPTEAQWEYACRAGTQTRYWSEDKESDLGRVGWYRGNSEGRLHAVGELEANDFGLHDMHGNVWEWCLDEMPESGLEPYTTSVRAGDGLRREPEGGGLRVVRGGSWFGDAGSARSACRYAVLAGVRGGDLGFRPAQAIS